jgi:CheY-like chemotaxis protein
MANLINNAYKFTERGCIELGLKMQHNDLAIYVKDTGIGIGEVDLAIIFNRFRKSDIRNSTLYRGTGLGLAISKALAQLLGCKLKVESEVGKGSVFSLILPYTLVSEEDALTNTFSRQHDLLKWTGKNILIVEDEQANYLYVKQMLSKTDAGIYWAENGLEAVKLASSGIHFHLILMDIKMPVMDGFEATKIIKSNLPGQIIIALTAYARPEDRNHFISAGFDDYLTKPIKPNDFMGVIRSLV